MLCGYVPESGDILWLTGVTAKSCEHAPERRSCRSSQELDWRRRKAKRKRKASAEELTDARAKIVALLRRRELSTCIGGRFIPRRLDTLTSSSAIE